MMGFKFSRPLTPTNGPMSFLGPPGLTMYLSAQVGKLYSWSWCHFMGFWWCWAHLRHFQGDPMKHSLHFCNLLLFVLVLWYWTMVVQTRIYW